MHVYFIEAICRPPLVKIGISSNVRGRMNTLQTSMPFELKLIGCVPHSSVHAARQAEIRLHKKLKRRRIQGEWFRLTPKTREFITELVGDSTSIPAASVLPVAVNEPNYDPPPAISLDDACRKYPWLDAKRLAHAIRQKRVTDPLSLQRYAIRIGNEIRRTPSTLPCASAHGQNHYKG